MLVVFVIFFLWNSDIKAVREQNWIPDFPTRVWNAALLKITLMHSRQAASLKDLQRLLAWSDLINEGLLVRKEYTSESVCVKRGGMKVT